MSETELKINEFLDVYSLYLRTGISLIREEARLKAYELRWLDPKGPVCEFIRRTF